MNVVVIGASGGVGRCLVEQALVAGHHVTAAVRRPAEIPRRDLLRATGCDVFDADSVSEAVKGQDAVFCTLGEASRGRTTLYSKGVQNVLSAMQTNGVRRLIFLSNFGILDERAQDIRGALLLFLVRHFIRHTLADHRRALEEMRAHASEWIAVRPMALTNGRLTGRYRTSVDGIPKKGWKISRADVAHFMLQQAAGKTHLNQVPAIAY